MASTNPFASLFAGFQQPASAYSTPFSMKGYMDSLKKKNQSTVSGPLQAPYAANPAATPAKLPVTGTPAESIGMPKNETPSTPKITSSAGQDYIKSLSASPTTYNAASAGTPSVPTPQPQEDPYVTEYKSAFADYLKSLSPSEEETTASKTLSDLQLQAKREEEKALESGDTLGFAAGEAARVNRNRSFDIEAASNALNALTGKRTATTEGQKARLDFTKSLLPEKTKEEGFTLGPDQVRYDAKGNRIAGGGSTTAGGAYTEGADPTVDAYVKAVRNNTTKLENVPTQYRDRVAQGVTSGSSGQDPKTQYVKAQATEALTNIDTALGLLQDPNNAKLSENPFGRAVGGFIPGSSVANLNAALDTVKALVGFDALQKMRESSPTGGALGNITERELAFLQSVQGSLNTNQSTEQLVNTINRVKQSFQTLQIVNSPDGTIFELNGQKYRKKGNEMEAVDFSSVGGDTNQALNVPQRNKNPGNLKSGGLADALAVGKDNQGHLIFPSAEVGFEALAQDLGAKISGRSTKVGPNPTIAQLGSVYAEDPGWASKVAKMLGVPTSMRTDDVDFDQLLEAIARQEGFYA